MKFKQFISEAQTQQIDELSKKTLGSYMKKARDDRHHSNWDMAMKLGTRKGLNRGKGNRKPPTPYDPKGQYAKDMKRRAKRDKGMDLATKKLTREAADDPYAIGMAKAKKMYNDEPPLKKKTIKKAHDIADAIKKEEFETHDYVNLIRAGWDEVNNAGEVEKHEMSDKPFSDEIINQINHINRKIR